MKTSHLIRHWIAVVMLGILVGLAGCSGGGGGAETPFTAPSVPVAGQNPLDPFSVVTQDYFYLYTNTTLPFPAGYQFADGHYPLPVSYETRAALPAGFTLPQESELAFEGWATADPRVAMVSGAPVGNERIHVIMVDNLTYNNIPNIIGLTVPVGSMNSPRFDVYVTTIDPISKQPMSGTELAKILWHEIGHALGLGHSPDSRDLMFYKDNSTQGATRRTFLTFGDAMAVWDTLNNRRINWVAGRPSVTIYNGGLVRRGDPDAGVVTTGMPPVCIYTRP